AIRTCGIARNKLFITTKVAAEHKDYRSAAKGIDGSLKAMGLDYIDLMIIHSPQPWMEVNQSDNRYFEGNLEAWRALTDAYKAGKLRSIGVSNFLKEDIDNIWNNAEVKPMVNQVLCHISNTPLDLIEYCQSKGIVMEAYSPVAHGEALRISAIAEMAKKYGVSIPQLCIRYDIQLGMVVLPKTANPEHMKTNADVDFTISEEDMETLKRAQKIDNYGESSFFPVFGGKL
ncbi:MAG: aldo/keto reductase, partial [Clostridia bacterium]|nr:aldo/keto reductase [Clostridia bacterium]